MIRLESKRVCGKDRHGDAAVPVGFLTDSGVCSRKVAQPAHRVKDKRLRRAFGILDTARWLGFVTIKGLLPTPVEQG